MLIQVVTLYQLIIQMVLVLTVLVTAELLKVEAVAEGAARLVQGQQILDLAVALVVLAGFMRILTPGFVEHYAGRLLNIHPSLLPSFPGLNTHQRAIDAGCKFAGASVHQVTAELDVGPILDQAVVPVLAGDTAETLSARVLVAMSFAGWLALVAGCQRAPVAPALGLPPLPPVGMIGDVAACASAGAVTSIAATESHGASFIARFNVLFICLILFCLRKPPLRPQ